MAHCVDRTTPSLPVTSIECGIWDSGGMWRERLGSSAILPLSIVLISLQRPHMSVYRVATQLRSQAGGRQLRLIALTTSMYVQVANWLAKPGSSANWQNRSKPLLCRSSCGRTYPNGYRVLQ